MRGFVGWKVEVPDGGVMGTFGEKGVGGMER